MIDSGRWLRQPATFIRWRPDLGPDDCLLEQLRQELEHVEQWQTPNRVGDRRLLSHHVLHVSQASPGLVRRVDHPRTAFINARKAD